jgi:carbon-monoxide dehydrogenase medium subunit
VKPPIFDYARPDTLDEVVDLLAQHGSEAKVLAGGQSLMPLLNFRMLRPGILVDINYVSALAHLQADETAVRLGALTRHHTLETAKVISDRFPVLAAATAHVAHLAIRNRGTIGGSLSHADPAAELPMMAILLNAELHVRSRGRARTIPAQDFFVGPLTTALRDDEVVTEVVVPNLPPLCGWSFEEFAQRMGDFAIVAVAVILQVDRGRVAEARLALMGVDETPVRLREIEKEIVGEIFSSVLASHVAQRASQAVNPTTDLKASSEYRRHLVRALTRRAMVTAASRAQDRA